MNDLLLTAPAPRQLRVVQWPIFLREDSIMKHPLILVAILGALFLTPGCVLAQPDLRPELERAFSAYFSALERGDAEEFKRSLATFRYMKMRNQAISRGEKFPDSFFDEVRKHGGFPIDLKKLKHVKTVPRGNVAYMIYYGKESINLSSDPAAKEKLVPVIASLLFVKEGDQWKFCEAERTHFEEKDLSVPPAKLANEGDPIFHESEGALSGNLPAVPPEYPTPDYIGSIVINAENCKVTVKYNAETDSIEDGSFATPLIGGLRRGKNAISINVEPLSEKTANARKSTGTPHAEVEVVVYSDQGRSSAKVFHFETDRPGEVNKEFEVTDEIITKAKQMSLRPIR